VPIEPDQRASLRGARTATNPLSPPATEPISVQRRIPQDGVVMVTRQRLRIGSAGQPHRFHISRWLPTEGEAVYIVRFPRSMLSGGRIRDSLPRLSMDGRHGIDYRVDALTADVCCAGFVQEGECVAEFGAGERG
jgi:hypothetical protein